jgi:hypothetical protein
VRRTTVPAHLLELLVELACLLRQLDVSQAHTGACLINQVNGLVGQEAVAAAGTGASTAQQQAVTGQYSLEDVAARALCCLLSYHCCLKASSF